MTDPSNDPSTPAASPGAFAVLLALPAAGALLLVLVLGPGILLAVGALAVLVAIPILGTRWFGPKPGGPS